MGSSSRPGGTPRRRVGRAGPLTLALLLAGCAGGPAVTQYDGTYRGDFIAQVGASPESCPRTETGAGTMTIRDGHAFVPMIRGAEFSGDVSAGGALTMISALGRFAVVSGHIARGAYVAQGSGVCQYDVHMVRTP